MVEEQCLPQGSSPVVEAECPPSPMVEESPRSPTPVLDPCPCSLSPMGLSGPGSPSSVEELEYYPPSPLPKETAGERDSPMLQSPVPGPGQSPCARLSFSPGQEEDSLSPLFHCSLSDDSGGSPAPSLGHAKKR